MNFDYHFYFQAHLFYIVIIVSFLLLFLLFCLFLDKILVDSSLIILASQGFISVIIPVIIVLRDIVVDAIKMEAASKGKVVAAIYSGKLKTATLMVGTVLTFFYNMPFEIINIRVADFFLYFATIMAIISAIEYFNINKKLIFGGEELL